MISTLEKEEAELALEENPAMQPWWVSELIIREDSSFSQMIILFMINWMLIVELACVGPLYGGTCWSAYANKKVGRT